MSTWGMQLQALTELEERTGVTPQALLDKPELDPVTQEVFDAFELLSTTRTVGFGSPNPISLSEIESFFRLFGEPSLGREVFIRLIKMLDGQALTKK